MLNARQCSILMIELIIGDADERIDQITKLTEIIFILNLHLETGLASHYI